MSGFESGLFKRPWVRYGLAVVAVAVGFLLRGALSAEVGQGLPPYITFVGKHIACYTEIHIIRNNGKSDQRNGFGA